MVTVSKRPLKHEDIEKLYAEVAAKIGKDTYFDNLVTMQEFWTRRSLTQSVLAPNFEEASEKSFDSSLVSSLLHP